MRMKYDNPKLKQSQIANQLGYSTSTLQRYRNDIGMLSPYRINPKNTKKRTKKTSKTTFDNGLLPNSNNKRPRLTSNDLKPASNESVKSKKSKLKRCGSVEINDQYLDEILDNNNIYIKLAMENVSNDRTIRSETIQHLKNFNS